MYSYIRKNKWHYKTFFAPAEQTAIEQYVVPLGANSNGKRSYISSIANTDLTNSYKRYAQGHCDQGLLTSKRLLSLQLSRLRRSTQTSWLRAVGVYKAVQRSNPHTKQPVNGRRPRTYSTYLYSTSNIPIFHNFIATIACTEWFMPFCQLCEPIRTINLAIS